MNEKQYEVRMTDFALEAVHGIASYIAHELFNDAAAVRWLEKSWIPSAPCPISRSASL